MAQWSLFRYWCLQFTCEWCGLSSTVRIVKCTYHLILDVITVLNGMDLQASRCTKFKDLWSHIWIRQLCNTDFWILVRCRSNWIRSTWIVTRVRITQSFRWCRFGHKIKPIKRINTKLLSLQSVMLVVSLIWSTFSRISSNLIFKLGKNGNKIKIYLIS